MEIQKYDLHANELSLEYLFGSASFSTTNQVLLEEHLLKFVHQSTIVNENGLGVGKHSLFREIQTWPYPWQSAITYWFDGNNWKFKLLFLISDVRIKNTIALCSRITLCWNRLSRVTRWSYVKRSINFIRNTVR